MNSPIDLIFRDYQPEDEPAVLRLMKSALGETSARRRNPATWRWKHFENPFGTSLIRLACNRRGEAVGLRAFMRWQFQIEGTTIDAVQAVDTATRRDYQGRGVFSALTAQAIEQVREDRVQFVFNTPNISARGGYLKLGWRYVGTIEPLIRARSPRLFLPRLALGALRRSQGESADGRYEASAPRCSQHDYDQLGDLISQHEKHSAPRGRLRTRWTRDYYRWRYVAQPDLTYRLHKVESNGVLRAAAITRFGARFGLKELLISELWTAEPDEQVLDELVRRISEAAGADYILAVANSDSFAGLMLRKRGFARVWQPSINSWAEQLMKGYQKPRRLLVRLLHHAPYVEPQKFEQWDLSVGDLEIF
jgi:GNAT superfamily N-acetyltransferase